MGSLCNDDAEVTQAEVDSAMWAYQEATDCGCYEDGIRAALSSFVRDRIEAEQLNQDRKEFMALAPEIRAHLLNQVRILRHD